MRFKLALVMFIALSGAAQAQQPWTFGNNTKFLALGDSLTAGYGASPVTNGYAYQLYQRGVYDSMHNTTFANAAVPGATSQFEVHPTNAGYRAMAQAFIAAK